jgi:hypothetical protein
VKLRNNTSIWRWTLLGLAMVGAVSAQFFSALPLMGLMLVAVIVIKTKARLPLVITSVLAGIACLPLGMAAISQKSQVSWLGDGPYSIMDQALVEAWFTSRWGLNPAEGMDPLHYLAVALSIIAGLTVVIALISGRPLPKEKLALAFVPPFFAVAVLWGVSLADAPVLLGRYLTSSTPFIAMLLAECLLLLRPYAKQLMASLLAVGCILLIVSQRQPYAKIPSNDYSFIASTLNTQAENADGLLIEPGLGPVDSARNAMKLYPKEFSRLMDIAQPRPEPLTFVFAADPPIVDITQGPIPPRVWLVTKNEQDSNYAAQLAKLGFEQTLTTSGPGHTVGLWVKQ